MSKAQKFCTFLLMLTFIPILFWFFALAKFQVIPKQHTFKFIVYAYHETMALHDFRLIAAFFIGLIVAFVLGWMFDLFEHDNFRGRAFKRHLRGTKIVSVQKLARKTTERKQVQIRVANIPIPTKVEALHVLLNGATGTGKSVIISSMVADAVERGDRVIVIDPNGDLFSKFGKKGDTLLNPFDRRSTGWNIFNEINSDFDYNKITESIVPKGKDSNSEQWNSYARVLLREAMRVMMQLGSERPTMKQVQFLCTQADEAEMQKKLANTDAMSLFVKGADKALGSARFTLSDRLPPYNLMPDGDFSIKAFLKNEKGGSLYITWREDQTAALRPLISGFVDIICTGALSLSPSSDRRLWLFLDELASLDSLSSLGDALEKGRKHGLRIVAGLQSIAQLRRIYGKDQAQTLMSNFRSLIVLGGSKTDSETAEEMSKALGEHEVIRESVTKTSGTGSSNRSEQTVKERVVMPSEISNLPILTGYVSFAGEYPISYVTLKPVDYKVNNKAFVETNVF
jgi:type IV secretory pathway TraG/TraD family ATPase VirD4